jgi:hypothetical protein
MFDTNRSGERSIFFPSPAGSPIRDSKPLFMLSLDKRDCNGIFNFWSISPSERRKTRRPAVRLCADDEQDFSLCLWTFWTSEYDIIIYRAALCSHLSSLISYTSSSIVPVKVDSRFWILPVAFYLREKRL